MAAKPEPDWRLGILRGLIERVYAQLSTHDDMTDHWAKELQKLLLPLLREYRMTEKDLANRRGPAPAGEPPAPAIPMPAALDTGRHEPPGNPSDAMPADAKPNDPFARDSIHPPAFASGLEKAPNPRESTDGPSPNALIVAKRLLREQKRAIKKKRKPARRQGKAHAPPPMAPIPTR